MADNPQRLTVPLEAAGQRLDQFLAAALGCTRGEAQRKIAQGAVTTNGALAEKDRRLIAGDEIVVLPDHTPPPILVPQPRIVAEDESILVLEKPSGLVMHSAPGVREPTLADWLLQNRPTITGIGEDQARPGIVHRLDREASGLVVVAKTQPTYEFLKAAFQEHRVEKHYLALVHGLVPQDADTINFPIERSERDGKMIAKAVGGSGRDAETTFTVLERIPPFTLLDVVTKTGRTHQVRVHLHAYGYPIAGDPLYHPKRRETKREPPRMFLHAARLRFPHPDGGERTFESPLPEDLAKFLNGSQVKVNGPSTRVA